MKTPSYLPLILLVAALPASAEIKAGDRCDTAFLEKVSHDFGAGGIVADAARIENRSVAGVTVPVLKFEEATTCDATIWRHLVTANPRAYRNAEVGRHWDKSNAGGNAAVLLIASDFFKAFDLKTAEFFAAADAVIDAGVLLGVATSVDSTKPLSEVVKGASGGVIGAHKAKTVTVVESGKTNAGPEQLGPTLRKLVDETGATKGGGQAVVRFRLAVLALEAELGRLGASNAAVVKRVGNALPTAKDFLPGLPSGYVTLKADKATALDDAKFGVGLAALIGAGAVPALDSTAARTGSALESVDLGLRNLVAIRADQVEKIVALAKARLKGGKVTDIEAAARAAGEGKKAPNPLAAAVFERVAGTPEYMRLDVLYENNKREKGDAWVSSPEGKAVYEERQKLKDSAFSAKIENGAVVFTQGGRTTALGSLVPSVVESDPAARSDAAAVISRYIIDGTVSDAKYKAVVAAVGGDGQPGAPLDTGLTGGEVAVSKDVPPATKKIREGSQGCEDARDLVNNDYEIYASRKRSAAADLATANVRTRNGIEAWRNNQLEASEKKCQQKKDEALSIKQDYFDDPAVAKAAKKKAWDAAVAWCAADKEGIEDAAKTKFADFAARVETDRNPNRLVAQADADLAAAFGVAIAASIDTLRKDYTTKGNARITCIESTEVDCSLKENWKLTEITRGSPKLTVFTALWFATEWPQEASKKEVLEASIASCAKALGLGDTDRRPSYRNPDDPNNVDSYCKVNEKITAYIKNVKGLNKPVP